MTRLCVPDDLTCALPSARGTAIESTVNALATRLATGVQIADAQTTQSVGPLNGAGQKRSQPRTDVTGTIHSGRWGPRQRSQNGRRALTTVDVTGDCRHPTVTLLARLRGLSIGRPSWLAA